MTAEHIKALWWNSTRLYIYMVMWFAVGCVFFTLNSIAGDDRVYRRILPSDPIDLDPARLEDVNALHIMLQVSEGLVRLYNNQIQPAVALRWDTSADLKEYQFHLNPRAKFSDGRTITANDVLRSFQYLLGTNSLVWRELSIIVGAREYHEGTTSHIAGIEIQTAQIIKISLLKPFAPFLEILATPPFVILPPESLATLRGGNLAPFISSGPYQITRYDKGSSLQLERNVYYHTVESVFFDRIIYDVVRSPLLAKAAFFGGLYDDVWPIFISELPPELRDHYEKIPAYSANIWYLEFNLNKPNVSSLPLRRFVAENIDRAAFLSELRLPPHFLATRFIPRGLLGHVEEPALMRTGVAEHMLDQSGCFVRSPCTVDLIYEKNIGTALEKLFQPITKKYSDRIQIGITKIERHAWYQRFIHGNYEMIYIGNNARYADAYSLLSYLMMEMYHPGLNRDAIGQQLEVAFETSDRVARGAIYKHVDDLLLQQYAVVPLYQSVVPYLFVRKGYTGHNVPILGPSHLALRDLRRID